MTTVIVYSQPDCRPCERVKSTLRDAGIDFVVHDITEDEYARDYVKHLGARSVPVIEVEGREPIMGYDMGKLKDLIHDYVYEEDE